jgi:MraZ protein
MPLTGTYTRSLDEKQRLAVPKKLREQFGKKELIELYVAPGTDRSLALYSADSFAELANRFAQVSPNRVDVRNYMRLFYARAENVPLDGQGRIRIPERLMELGGVSKDVVLLGVQDHAEIWDKQLWDEFLGRSESDFDDMATRVFD